MHTYCFLAGFVLFPVDRDTDVIVPAFWAAFRGVRVTRIGYLGHGRHDGIYRYCQSKHFSEATGNLKSK